MDKKLEDILPPSLINRIDEIITIVDNKTENWITVKSLIANSFPFKYRFIFEKNVRLSHRDKNNRKIIRKNRVYLINKLEFLIIDYWKRKTGVTLKIERDRFFWRYYLEKEILKNKKE